MKMIKYSFLLVGAIVLSLTSCVKDDFEGTTYPLNDYKVGGTQVIATFGAGEFDLAGAASESNATYTVRTVGAALSSLGVKIAYNGGATADLGSITAFPANGSVNFADALSALGLTKADVEVGKTFSITFDLSGGKTPASISIPVVNTEVIFRSALQGEFAAVTTCTDQAAGISWDGCAGQVWEGTVILEARHTDPEATGAYDAYTLDDAGEKNLDMAFGAFYPCYGSGATGLPLGDLVINDVDGKLSFAGASQWGEVYSFSNVSASGAVLTFNWTNDYGEGALVVLTRTDGTDWPEDLR